MPEAHWYTCRACGNEVVECILSCPCVRSHVCEECVADGREPIVKIEGPLDPGAPEPVA